jgi:hypothetical protein
MTLLKGWIHTTPDIVAYRLAQRVSVPGDSPGALYTVCQLAELTNRKGRGLKGIGSKKSQKSMSARVDAFWTQVLLTGLAILAVVLGVVSRPGDANYTRVQNSLFGGALLIVLLFVLTRKDHLDMLTSVRKAMARPRSLQLEDWTNLLKMLMFAAALTCFFVLDLSGLGAGFRVGGVAAIGLCRILTGVIRRSQLNQHTKL